MERSRAPDGGRATAALFVAAAAGLTAGRAGGWVAASWLELFAVVSGAGCVLLTVSRRVLNFPVGILSSAAYLGLFAGDRLYADAGLQVVFIALGLHGWAAWVRGRADPRPVRRVPVGELTAVAVLFPGVWLGLTALLEAVGGAAPPFDAFIAAASLGSQWLLNRRYVETWLGWLVVDQVAVVLFWSRGLHLTAGLYAVFLGMCVAGLVAWRRDLARGPAR